MRHNPVLRELGFSASDRVAIIHADDIGMCHSTVPAFFELAAAGLVSAGSAMVPCLGFQAAAAWWRRYPETDLGVHLTLTSEWENYRWGPLSACDAASGLVDDFGCFYQSPALMNRPDPRAAVREMRAQVQHARNAGIDVTHIDCHMFAMLAHGLANAYVDLGFRAGAARPHDASAGVDPNAHRGGNRPMGRAGDPRVRSSPGNASQSCAGNSSGCGEGDLRRATRGPDLSHHASGTGHSRTPGDSRRLEGARSRLRGLSERRAARPCKPGGHPGNRMAPDPQTDARMLMVQVQPEHRGFLNGVRTYYDKNTPRFAHSHQSAVAKAMHREVWGPCVQTEKEAFEYVNALVLGAIGEISDRFPSPMRVLDLGCGIGGTLLYLAARIAVDGIGVTLSRVGVRLAEGLAREFGARRAVPLCRGELPGPTGGGRSSRRLCHRSIPPRSRCGEVLSVGVRRDADGSAADRLRRFRNRGRRSEWGLEGQAQSGRFPTTMARRQLDHHVASERLWGKCRITVDRRSGPHAVSAFAPTL